MSNVLTRPLSIADAPPWLRTRGPILPALLVLASLFGLVASQTPDSIQYLSAAQTFRQSGGFGAEYLLWPPLYPALLALWPDSTFAALLGDLGATASLVGAWLLGRRVFVSPVTLGIVLLVLVTVTRFGMVFGMVWSEAVFIPIAIWLSYFWAKHLDGERGLSAACLLLSFALLTRHVGVVLAIAMGVTALRLSRPWRSLAAIGVACIPYALWLWRTYLLCGEAMGPRPLLAHANLPHQIDLFGGVWTHWLIPHVYAGGMVAGIVVLAAFAAALALVRNNRFLTFAALVLLGHCVLTVYSASRLSLDVDARTLFPVFWLALLLVAYLIECGMGQLSGRSSKVARMVLGVYLLMWFSAPNAIINALV